MPTWPALFDLRQLSLELDGLKLNRPEFIGRAIVWHRPPRRCARYGGTTLLETTADGD